MSRFDKGRKISVLIELEKMRNIDFALLWHYLNSEILEVESIDDENFVRADEFFEYLDKLANARSSLDFELTREVWMMFNKKEKMYFIQRLFMNHINWQNDLQYKVNMEIVFMFKHLGYISQELFDELKPLINKSAYDESFSAIMKAQELLCEEFGIPIKEWVVFQLWFSTYFN